MATSPGPIEIKLGDGSVIKADTVEDALKMAVKMKEDTSSALREEREARKKIEDEQQRLSAQFAELQQRNQPPPQNNGGFSNDRYWQLMNQNPMEAQNYLDAYRFGLPNPADVPAHFQRMSQQLEKSMGDNLGMQFIQQHYADFPAGEESATALAGKVKELNDQGHPFTLDTMNMAYSQLVNSGKIKPLETKQPEDNEPNPSLTGAGAAIPDAEIEKAENMSTGDLEKYLRSKGMIS